MSWTYRVVQAKHADKIHEREPAYICAYSIREYYEQWKLWSDTPEAPQGATVDELVVVLRRMLRAALEAKRNPARVLEELNG
jgi:hypothetical protein